MIEDREVEDMELQLMPSNLRFHVHIQSGIKLS